MDAFRTSPRLVIVGVRRLGLASLLALMTLISGCALRGHTLKNPGVSQIVTATSGDEFSFELEENATTGYEWFAKSDDTDVEVRFRHQAPLLSRKGMTGVPGKVLVTVCIHRGYDGPSTVTFEYRRRWEKKVPPAKSFVLTFHRPTGDRAFWE